MAVKASPYAIILADSDPKNNRKPSPQGRGLHAVNVYLTAPATALVKLFCRQKKMMIVGREHSVTPAMTTP